MKAKSNPMRVMAVASVLVASSGFAEEVAVVLPDQGRHEVVLLPISMQINGERSNEHGISAGYVWHLRESFGVTARFSHSLWYGYGPEGEIERMSRTEEGRPNLKYPGWSAVLGTELAPLTGSGALLGREVSVRATLLGALGVTSLRSRTFQHFSTGEQPTFDLGLRPGAEVAIGARMKVGRFVAIRMELSNSVTSLSASTVDGCTFGEIDSMDKAARAARPISEVVVGKSCDRKRYEGKPYLLPHALSGLRAAGAPLLQTVSVRLGVSGIF